MKEILTQKNTLYICIECADLPQDKRCEKCATFYKFNNIDEYCQWAFKLPETIQICHNLRGYDGHFIFSWIMRNMLPSDPVPKALTCGNKFISIEFKDIRLVDSYSFIPGALATFPKTFGLKELKKGFFPHLFNKPHNFNYVGPYPAIEYYQPQFFSPSKRDEFFVWYQTKLNEVFDFKKKFESYCISDVELLTEGALVFRKLMIDISKKSSDDKGADLFILARTLPSFCNHLYRRNFLPKNSIALLRYIAEKNNIYI